MAKINPVTPGELLLEELLSNGYWLRAQAAYDTEVAESTLGETLAGIKPWKGPRQQPGNSA